MASFLLALGILIGAYLAMSVGANTVGSIVGIIRGSTNLNRRVAIFGTASAALLGIALLSGRIVDTISTKLIAPEGRGIFIILFAVAIIATALAFGNIPISTTYVVMGTIMGYAFIAGGGIDIFTLEKVMLSILISPFAALAAGFSISYLISRKLTRKLNSIQKIELLEMRFFRPGIIAALILAFALGANSIGIVMGLLGSFFDFTILFLIGAVGMIVGIATLGKRVAQKVGVEFTDLSPSRGFVVMLATGAIIFGFAYFGIPTSTTQTLFGALVGVGLATEHIGTREAAKVSLIWLLALPITVLIISFVFTGIVGVLI